MATAGALWVAGTGCSSDGGPGLGIPRDAGSTDTLRVVPVSDCLVRRVAAGARHTCGLAIDGTIVCWGANEAGQLGRAATDGGVEAGGGPGRAVVLPRTVVELAAGGERTCARLDNGLVACWGVLGVDDAAVGLAPPGAVPAALDLPTGARAVALGRAHGCVGLVDGTVACWGAAARVTGVDGGVVDTGGDAGPTLARVPGLEAVVALGAGGDSTCVVPRDGRPLCWGPGLNLPGVSRAAAPTPLDLFSRGALNVAVGPTMICTRNNDNGVTCQANRPDGKPESRATPAVRSLAVGGQHACAATVDGDVMCWGEGPGVPGGGPVNLERAQVYRLPRGKALTITAGDRHSCASTDQGEVLCWGDNEVGQRGGDPLPQPAPEAGVDGSADPEPVDAAAPFDAAPGETPDGSLAEATDGGAPDAPLVEGSDGGPDKDAAVRDADLPDVAPAPPNPLLPGAALVPISPVCGES